MDAGGVRLPRADSDVTDAVPIHVADVVNVVAELVTIREAGEGVQDAPISSREDRCVAGAVIKPLHGADDHVSVAVCVHITHAADADAEEVVYAPLELVEQAPV